MALTLTLPLTLTRTLTLTLILTLTLALTLTTTLTLTPLTRWLPLYWNAFYLAESASLKNKLFSIVSGAHSP